MQNRTETLFCLSNFSNICSASFVFKQTFRTAELVLQSKSPALQLIFATENHFALQMQK